MVEALRVEAGDVTLAVSARRAPDASLTPVVLLHGTGATSDTWDDVARVLGADRSVFTVDLRGHGASDRTPRYSIRAMAEDVAALLPRIADGPVDLVGHSLGGLVALRVAARDAHLLCRLVLEDVGVPHPREPDPPPRPAGVLPFDWRVVEQVRPEIDHPSDDWPQVAAAVKAPALIVAGRHSFVAAEHIAELALALADAKVVTLDAGHEVHRERTAEFTAALLDFLAP
jgi:pimeloyl-ACP methyl ester carboxylesterase